MTPQQAKPSKKAPVWLKNQNPLMKLCQETCKLLWDGHGTNDLVAIF